jgi:hypothetical protein
MDWRTSDEQARIKSEAEQLDRHPTGVGALAGAACPSLAKPGNSLIRLGGELLVDLQVARRTRGRFADALCGSGVIE